MDLLKMFASNFNVEVSWVKAGCSVDEYRKLVRKNTRVGRAVAILFCWTLFPLTGILLQLLLKANSSRHFFL